MPSRWGRWIEQLSYRDVLLLSVALVFLASIYFYLAPTTQGLNVDDEGWDKFGSSVYFSIVTMSSLGYGDIAPAGFGRAISCLLVLFGLMAVAILVGRLASERSQATLLLLHTSDRDRRLRDFASDIELAVARLKHASAVQRTTELRKATSELSTLLEAVSNYVVFHAHHANLGEFGNAPALLRVVRQLEAGLAEVTRALESPAADALVCDRTASIVSRIENTTSFVLQVQGRRRSDLTARLLERMHIRKETETMPAPLSTSQRTLLAKVGSQAASFRQTFLSHMHARHLANVLQACKDGPLAAWPKHEHKRIGSELGISNKLAQRCIDKLIAQHRLPKQ